MSQRDDVDFQPISGVWHASPPARLFDRYTIQHYRTQCTASMGWRGQHRQHFELFSADAFREEGHHALRCNAVLNCQHHLQRIAADSQVTAFGHTMSIEDGRCRVEVAEQQLWRLNPSTPQCRHRRAECHPCRAPEPHSAPQYTLAGIAAAERLGGLRQDAQACTAGCPVRDRGAG